VSVWTNLAISGAGGSTVGSWSGAYGNLNDANDATVVKKTTLGVGDSITYPTTDVTVPSNEVVGGLRWRCRMARPSYATKVTVGLKGVGEAGRPSVGAQTFAGFVSATTLTGPWVTLNPTAFVNPFTGETSPGPLTQAEVSAASIRLDDATTTSPASTYAASFLELGLDLQTVSVPTVAVVTPSGTVSDNLAPPITWAYADTKVATVTTKALTSNVVTLTTSAAHGFQPGNDVSVVIGDAVFDGIYKIIATPTSTTFTYAKTNTNVGSTGASGTATIGDDRPQATFEVKVYSAVQYGAADFDPSLSTATWSTSGTGTTATVIPAQLANGGSYRAYVRVTKLSSLGTTVTSTWAYSAFTLSADVAAAPVVTATWDAATQCTLLTVACAGNVLSADDATIEGSVGTWVAASNCTLSRSFIADTGTYSLQLLSTAAGTMSARTSTTAYAVLGSTAYSATARVMTAASARSVTLGIAWYNAAGSLISTSTGAASNDAVTYGTRTVTGTSPSNAVTAALVLTVASTGGASEIHRADQFALHPGSTPAFSIGGLTYSLTLTRASGAGAPVSVRPPVTLSTAQRLAFSDHEAPRGALTTYSAVLVGRAVSGGLVSTLPGTATATTTSDGAWWLKAVSTPALNAAVSVVGVPSEARQENLGQFRVDGRPDVVVVSGQTFGDDPDFTITTVGAADFETVRALLTHQGTLLLQEPYLDSDDVGRQRFVRVVDRSWTREGVPSRPRSTFTVRAVEVGQGY
jgi:hypothetical protein